MIDPTGLLLDGTLAGSALFTLVSATFFLLLVTVVFSGYAVVLRAGHEVRDRTWQALERRWREPVLAAIVDPEQAPLVHDLVEPKYRLYFVQFILDYSRRVKGLEKEVLREIVAPYLGPLVGRARHRRSEIRTRAIETLGALGLPAHADTVVAALDDESPLVRMVAARALARKEYVDFAPEVIARVERFDGWHRRFLSAMLASMGPSVAPTLRDRLLDLDAAPWVRTTVADALQLLRDPHAADPACALLEIPQERELTVTLLRIMQVVGRPEHRETVRRLCETDDPLLLGEALNALGHVGSREDIPFLTPFLESESPWVGLHAARGILEAGGREELERLATGDDVRAELAGQVLYEEDAP